MVKIILTEDHQLVRKGIRSLLEKEPDFEVVAEFDDGESVIEKLRNGLEADIIFVDIKMPDMDGVVLSETITKEFPDLKVIILSMMDHEKYLKDTFNSGVRAYLLKNASSEELIFAVRHVFEGNKYICSELSMKIYEKVMAFEERFISYNSPGMDLSERELSVLRLTADGNTNSEVAEILKMSKRTVEGMRKSMIDKSGTKNTAGLIQYAFRTGLLS
jgi:two-component system response regulator NreC